MEDVDFIGLRKPRKVPCKAWGGNVYLGHPPAKYFLQLAASNLDEGPEEEAVDFMVELASKVIRDKSGKLQFDDDGGRDYLATQLAAMIELQPAIMSLMGFDEFDEAQDGQTPAKKNGQRKRRKKPGKA